VIAWEVPLACHALRVIRGIQSVPIYPAPEHQVLLLMEEQKKLDARKFI
jgi:hypothetical protein